MLIAFYVSKFTFQAAIVLICFRNTFDTISNKVHCSIITLYCSDQLNLRNHEKIVNTIEFHTLSPSAISASIGIISLSIRRRYSVHCTLSVSDRTFVVVLFGFTSQVSLGQTKSHFDLLTMTTIALECCTNREIIRLTNKDD